MHLRTFKRVCTSHRTAGPYRDPLLYLYRAHSISPERKDVPGLPAKPATGNYRCALCGASQTRSNSLHTPPLGGSKEGIEDARFYNKDHARTPERNGRPVQARARKRNRYGKGIEETRLNLPIQAGSKYN